MNIQKHLVAILALVTALAIPATVFSQEDDARAQAHRDASIKRMQTRISEIESEMKEAEVSHLQALGEEALNLYSRIDQTFLQMKNAYQQQVIELNMRMQRKWEQVESAGVEDRDAINRALQQLEEDWDRTFDRLTRTHESHLEQLGDVLARLEGEFSDTAERVQAELKASNFEAVARWEEGHDLVLAINRTYAQIVNDQLQWQQKKLAEDSDDKEMMDRIARTRTRHAMVQERFQRRLVSHVRHLETELETRSAQLNASRVWETRREIMAIVDKLYSRTHTTFEMLQASYRDVYQANSSEIRSLPASDDRADSLAESIAQTRSTLSRSYLARVEFIGRQIIDLEGRIEKEASSEEQAAWTARMTDLRLLSRDLELKATQLEESPVRTVRR